MSPAADEGSTAERVPILCSCAACDIGIHIHLGPPLTIYDLLRGEPYAISELPKDHGGVPLRPRAPGRPLR